MTVLEDLLKQSLSCRNFISEKKIIEIGRPASFFTKMVKQSKNMLCDFSDFWCKTELQNLEHSLGFFECMIDIFTEKFVTWN